LRRKRWKRIAVSDERWGLRRKRWKRIAVSDERWWLRRKRWKRVTVGKKSGGFQIKVSPSMVDE
jgi:hypothetical protein